LYTPLEQYGGDGLHTDVRADIYAYGATLYHLLTNESPADARKRFLQPDSLLPLRQINPSLSQRTERAILWAMSLHPDQRPDSIESLRQALLGYREPPSVPVAVAMQQNNPSFWETITTPPDSILLWVTAGLFLLSLITTLVR
jgi:serine/threonine-protein kinase